MSMDLNGLWENSYGSLMDLTVSQDGGVVGTYSSTTGSTGKYNVIGHCSPCVPDAGKGRAVVLSIYWRSVGGDSYDDSWHWVSTYCGQLLENGELSVINSLVATSSFSGFSPGDYIDKLAFHRIKKASKQVYFNPDRLLSDNGVPSPINGLWLGVNPNVEFTLEVVNDECGLIKGVLAYRDQLILLRGFTDTYSKEGQRQSVSVCGYMSNNNAPISISGWLDPSSHVLNVSRWMANGTTLQNAYYQCDVESWLLRKK